MMLHQPPDHRPQLECYTSQYKTLLPKLLGHTSLVRSRLCSMGFPLHREDPPRSSGRQLPVGRSRPPSLQHSPARLVALGGCHICRCRKTGSRLRQHHTSGSRPLARTWKLPAYSRWHLLGSRSARRCKTRASAPLRSRSHYTSSKSILPHRTREPRSLRGMAWPGSGKLALLR